MSKITSPHIFNCKPEPIPIQALHLYFQSNHKFSNHFGIWEQSVRKFSVRRFLVRRFSLRFREIIFLKIMKQTE
jgi:hypothetical protein